MIISDISAGVSGIANIGSSAVQLHQVAQYFLGKVKKEPDYNFTFTMPETAKLMEHVELRGTAPPGIVYIYSQDVFERYTFPYPSTGEWFTGLYFSVPGKYIVYAVSNGNQMLHRYIEITE